METSTRDVLRGSGRFYIRGYDDIIALRFTKELEALGNYIGYLICLFFSGRQLQISFPSEKMVSKVTFPSRPSKTESINRE
jgi:hypothetical protein